MASNWRAWIVDRFALGQIKEHVLDRRVAKTPWYYGDGSTLLLLLGILVVTGLFMTLTYSPTPDTAYASVRYITDRQLLGWFVRGLHYWSAGMMVVMLFFHLFRQLLVGGYKLPREGTWLIGVLLFFAVLVMAFTGYVLRWDERGIHAASVVLHMFSRVPLIGEYLVLFVQGGAEVSALTLTRLYAVHVLFTPLALFFLVAYHVYLVVVHSITSPGERKQPIYSEEHHEAVYEEQAHSEEEGEKFYPDTFFSSGRMAMVVFLITVALALTAGPQELQPPANLVEPSAPAEEWWYWWYSALIAIVPGTVAPALVVALPLLVFAAMVLLPFLDRSPYRGIRYRPFMVGFVAVCVIGLLVLSNLRYTSPWTGWPRGEPPPVPAGVVLTEEAEEGRLLFAQYGCNSCHAVAGHGPRVAVDLATITARSRDEIRRYVLNPPEGVAMPSYAGRITEEDLRRVVGFVHVVQTFPRGQ